jgi:hypothetical protein
MGMMRDRLATSPGQAEYHPYGTGATPMTMPLDRVMITAEGMTSETLQPIYAGDASGAPIPATARGSWGQLYAAGRP